LTPSVGQMIKGVVQSQNGNPVIGAGVMIQHTNQGTATDDTGYFELEGIDAGRTTLIISAIGYINDTVPLYDLKKAELTSLEIVLQEGLEILEQLTISEKTES